MVTVVPFAVAVIVTGVLRRTRDVDTVKLAPVAPLGIFTVAGTLASELLLAKFTTTPAPFDTVTVPCVLRPPTTVLDSTTRAVGTAGGGAATLMDSSGS